MKPELEKKFLDKDGKIWQTTNYRGENFVVLKWVGHSVRNGIVLGHSKTVPCDSFPPVGFKEYHDVESQ